MFIRKIKQFTDTRTDPWGTPRREKHKKSDVSNHITRTKKINMKKLDQAEKIMCDTKHQRHRERTVSDP